MKTRRIHTKIWSDSWFVELPTPSKLFFLYLITGPKMGLSGYAEIPDRVICFDTGISDKSLQNAKNDLSEKIFFYKDWVYVKNLLKYDPIKGDKNSLWKALKNEIDNIPQEIKEKLDGGFTPPIPSQGGSNGIGNGNGKGNGKEETKKIDKSINSLNDEFCAKVARNYDVPLPTVLKKKNDLILYCRSTGKKYKDYQATLQAWIRKDLK